MPATRGPNVHKGLVWAFVLAGVFFCRESASAEGDDQFRRSMGKTRGPSSGWVVAAQENAQKSSDLELVERLRNSALSHKAEGRHKEAEALFHRALSILEKELGPEHPDLSYDLFLLADARMKMERFAEAEPLYRRILAINEKQFGPEHPDLSYDLFHLADARKKMGRFAEAEPLYQRILAIQEKQFAPDSKLLSLSLLSLAEVQAELGHLPEAESSYERVISLLTKELGPKHAAIATIHGRLGDVLQRQNRPVDAASHYKSALAIREKAFGPDHRLVDVSLQELAYHRCSQKRYDDCEALFRRSLAIKEKLGDTNGTALLGNLKVLGTLNVRLKRHNDAARFYQRALTLQEKNLEPDDPDVRETLDDLAGVNTLLGNHAEALKLYQRSLEITKKIVGVEHDDVANRLVNMGKTALRLRRLPESVAFLEHALAIQERIGGREHINIGTTLNNLAQAYSKQDRFAEAERTLNRALQFNIKTHGPDDVGAAYDHWEFGHLYGKQGRFAEAESHLKRALVIGEKKWGAESTDAAKLQGSLGSIYRHQGRYAEAESLLKRALAISEKKLGPDHPDIAARLNDLSLVYMSQDGFADAEPLLERVVTILEKSKGSDHLNMATALNNLAGVYEELGRYAEAESLIKRSLKIREKTLGPKHTSVGFALHSLGGTYLNGPYPDRIEEALSLLKRGAEIFKKSLGPDHPNTATSLRLVSTAHCKLGDFREALNAIRRASDIHRKRAIHSSGGRTGGGLSEQKAKAGVFLQHVTCAWRNAKKKLADSDQLTTEAFEAGQLAKATSTGAALAGMGARFAAGNDALARIVRERQDAAERWKRLDKRLVSALSRPPGQRDLAAEDQLRAQLMDLDDKLTDFDERLGREFPEYVELASPRPLSLADAGKLLGPDEALMAYLVGDKETYLWAVRRNAAHMFRLDIGRKGLSDAVSKLRRALDPSALLKGGHSDIPSFDTTEAFRLYEKMFSVAESFLGGIDHLFVVTDGALDSLPLGVLVTEEPQRAITDFGDYRNVPWLAKRYALTTLPSVSSLKALRRFAKASRANKPFGGFGDPLLEGHPGEARNVQLANLFSTRGLADVDAVKSMLAPLPETAGELQAIADTLGADKTNLFLREMATEAQAKEQPLNDYRVLAFATHGLVAGELKGLAEPALVMTPPESATRTDDGLLTASEVAGLKLNADLVVLSACNTAAADGAPGAEALSGLAKAFFYAGSRALLVSHWPVNSAASVELTTRMLKEVANDNQVGRAEALKRSMLGLMDTAETPLYAHPMFWAPFVVVGEGGSYKAD